MRDKFKDRELEEFIKNHEVIYIRHSMASTPQVYQKLISEGIVAVHYTDYLKGGVNSEDLENHKDPENYEGTARKVLKRLERFCREGVVVFADYSDPPKGLKLKAVNIGIIPERECYKPVRYLPGNEDYPKGFIYKQVKLHNYVTLSHADVIPLLAIQPRGGTVVRWPSAEKLVKFFYKRKLGLKIDPKSISPELLLPFQQEVLCSEYLRTKAPEEIRLKYLLLPVGRGLKAIDIDGANDVNRIFAQVSLSKNENEIKVKVNELRRLAKEYRGPKKLIQVYFGPDEKREFIRQIAPEIRFISLEEVFNALRDTGILNDMLPPETKLVKTLSPNDGESP